MARALTASELVEVILQAQHSSEPIEINKEFSYTQRFFKREDTSFLTKVYFSESNKGQSSITIELVDNRYGRHQYKYQSFGAKDQKTIESLIRQSLNC